MRFRGFRAPFGRSEELEVGSGEWGVGSGELGVGSGEFNLLWQI